jgi:hypothetical protein
LAQTVIDRALSLLRRLAPPSLDENGEVQDDIYRVQRYEMRGRQWRWTVFYSLCLIFSVLTAQVAASWGLTPVFSGFAGREEVQREVAGMKGQVSRIEIRQLEQTLLDTRSRQCMAADKRFITERFNELLREYFVLTGQNWRIPDCDELRG